jgi:hypothetical protein
MLRQRALGHARSDSTARHRRRVARGEWGRAREHADTLEALTRDERLPYVDFLIARGCAATLGEDRGTAQRRPRSNASSARRAPDWRPAARLTPHAVFQIRLSQFCHIASHRRHAAVTSGSRLSRGPSSSGDIHA